MLEVIFSDSLFAAALIGSVAGLLIGIGIIIGIEKFWNKRVESKADKSMDDFYADTAGKIKALQRVHEFEGLSPLEQREDIDKWIESLNMKG